MTTLTDKTLAWERHTRPRIGKTEHSYVSAGGEYGIVRGQWKRHGQAITSGRTSYRTTHTMKGWAIYHRGRYLTRRRTLALAKGVAEAHSRGMSVRELDR